MTLIQLQSTRQDIQERLRCTCKEKNPSVIRVSPDSQHIESVTQGLLRARTSQMVRKIH